jgi:hypothetical protein
VDGFDRRQAAVHLLEGVCEPREGCVVEHRLRQGRGRPSNNPARLRLAPLERRDVLAPFARANQPARTATRPRIYAVAGAATSIAAPDDRRTGRS